MFKRRTLFIVGARASQEVDFPVGTKLAKSIGQKLIRRVDNATGRAGYGDSELYRQLRGTFPNEINEYFVTARRIAEGIQLANSIDDFLNIHSAYYGKPGPKVMRLGLEAFRRIKYGTTLRLLNV